MENPGAAAIVRGVEKASAPDPEVLGWISDTLRGNPQAFRGIVHRYQPLVLRLSLSYLGSPEEAEDATQEIFLKAYLSLPRFRLERRFVPWLYSIAVNHLKSRYARIRRVQERRSPGDPADAIAAAAGRNGIPEAALEAAELRRRVQEALRSLPGGVRDAAVLYYSEGLDVASIAEALGIGLENVKSRLHRARKLLRTLLEEDAT